MPPLRPALSQYSLDPYYSSVSLLLHFDGADGGGTFTDNSPHPLAPSSSSNAQTSATQFKFGTTSFNTTAITGKLQYASTAALSMGTGDFTLEFWTYITDFTAEHDFWSNDSSAGSGYLAMEIETTKKVRVYFNAGSTLIDGGTAITSGAWTFVALTRASGTFTLWINGSSDGTATPSAQTMGSANFSIGAVAGPGGDNKFPTTSFMDDFRLTKGVARYTTNFTPPTRAFPNT